MKQTLEQKLIEQAERRKYLASYWGPSTLMGILAQKQISVRTLNALRRDRTKVLSDITYDQFLIELAKPNGGTISMIVHVGPVTIEELRAACLVQLSAVKRSPEYGYA